jgi:TRAP-type mannitol/chloroaromatic compound transport system permease small subunit
MENHLSWSSRKKAAYESSDLFCRFNRVIKFIEDWFNLFAVFIIMFLMFFASIEISSRYIFNYPIPGHLEIVELIMPVIVFLSISYTERVGGHVRMELFLSKVLKGRAYHMAETITCTLCLLIFLFFLVYTFKSSLFAYHIGDVSAYSDIPTWPSKFAVPLGFLLLCIRFGIETVQHIAQIIVGGEIRDMDNPGHVRKFPGVDS